MAALEGFKIKNSTHFYGSREKTNFLMIKIFFSLYNARTFADEIGRCMPREWHEFEGPFWLGNILRVLCDQLN